MVWPIMRRAVLLVLALSAAFAGVVVAAAMMHIAWEHNPQSEFYDETGVHWFRWLAIGFSWFVAVGLPVALVGGVLSTIARRLACHVSRRRRTAPDQTLR